MKDVIHVIFERYEIIFRTGDPKNPCYAKKYSPQEFAKIISKMKTEIAQREDPYERVELWECQVNGVYFYDKEEKIFKSRNGKTCLELLEEEIKEMKEELERKLQKSKKRDFK